MTTTTTTSNTANATIVSSQAKQPRRRGRPSAQKEVSLFDTYRDMHAGINSTSTKRTRSTLDSYSYYWSSSSSSLANPPILTPTATASVPTSVLASSKYSSTKIANRGTLKRREQTREILKVHDEEEGLAMQAKQKPIFENSSITGGSSYQAIIEPRIQNRPRQASLEFSQSYVRTWWEHHFEKITWICRFEWLWVERRRSFVWNTDGARERSSDCRRTKCSQAYQTPVTFPACFEHSRKHAQARIFCVFLHHRFFFFLLLLLFILLFSRFAWSKWGNTNNSRRRWEWEFQSEGRTDFQ